MSSDELVEFIAVMKEEGYTEEEAIELFKEKIRIKYQMEHEKKKKILTGQLINKKILYEKEQELKGEK